MAWLGSRDPEAWPEFQACQGLWALSAYRESMGQKESQGCRDCQGRKEKASKAYKAHRGPREIQVFRALRVRPVFPAHQARLAFLAWGSKPASETSPTGRLRRAPQTARRQARKNTGAKRASTTRARAGTGRPMCFP